jgi:hypothetical protein
VVAVLWRHGASVKSREPVTVCAALRIVCLVAGVLSLRECVPLLIYRVCPCMQSGVSGDGLLLAVGFLEVACVLIERLLPWIL